MEILSASDAKAVTHEKHASAGVSRVNRAAVELGRRGGRKGGSARATGLSPAERSAAARKAARARWGKAEEPDAPAAGWKY